MNKYGFLSKTAALSCPHYLYTQDEPPVGDNVVAVTLVGEKGDKADTDINYYNWADKERVSSINQIIGGERTSNQGEWSIDELKARGDMDVWDKFEELIKINCLKGIVALILTLIVVGLLCLL